MLRSMYSGVSGLKAHQIKMDVIGNNIANVNTIGFKSSRVNFKEMLNQTLQGASAPAEDGTRGGMNPQQIGLGVGIGSIDVNHTQGNLQPTGKTEDLAIDGNGFFVLSNGSQNFYTRSGALTLDEDGNLVNSTNGLKLQGWMADASGNINTNQRLEDIIIPIGTSMGPRATTMVSFGKNLNSEVEDYVDEDTTPDSRRTATIDVFDSLGTQHTISIEFRKLSTADNIWEWTVEPAPGSNAGITDADNIQGSGTITFTPEGKFDSFTSDTVNADGDYCISFNPIGTSEGSASPQEIIIDFSGMTQYADPYTVDGITADGYSNGELKSYSINDAGIITGSYSNGLTRAIGQIAIASFNNPAGLTKEGDVFVSSPNSGIPQIGVANSAGRGKIASGSLEMSNVDLAEQFTEMITTQRGFQANSKIITTGDEMLQELVNLKR
ncbi:MAG: flagellar hook protein FlgE [Halanaerobiaceae bacterium]|nr:flagellar hook protein FlgE [Halanaerobiaceae bacterium]